MTSSSRTSYRPRRFFMRCIKNHRSLIPSLLLSKSNPLRWAPIWFFPSSKLADPAKINDRSYDRSFVLRNTPRLGLLNGDGIKEAPQCGASFIIYHIYIISGFITHFFFWTSVSRMLPSCHLCERNHSSRSGLRHHD